MTVHDRAAAYRDAVAAGARRRLALRRPARLRRRRARRSGAARRAATARPRLETRRCRGAGACRRSSTSRRPPAGTSARRTTSTASASPATSRCGRSSTTTRRSTTWTVPVRGEDVYQVAVGPIHAGVIESGHFRFHVVGDRILHLDARLFYKHRGLERAAEGSHARPTGLAYVAPRLRRLRGRQHGRLRPRVRGGARPRGRRAELARARTILLELERLWNHLNDIAAVCAGVGLAAGNNRFAALTERARRLNARLTGHRFLFGTRRVGGSDARARRRRPSRTRATELAAICARTSSRGWRELLFNASFQERLAGHRRASTRDDARAARRRRPGGARRRRRARTSARTARASPTPASSPSRPSGRPATSRARLEQRALELLPVASTSSTGCSTGPVAARRRARRRPGRGGDRRRARREPARRDALHRRARRRPHRPPAPAHRLLRQLARGRPRRRRQPAARLPAHQQELRALLRLRRPLMLTLLRDLRQLRRDARARRAPDRGRSLAIRHVDAGSCNGCEHELTLASSPYYDLQRFGLGIVASPRHADVLLVTGPVTTRMRDAAPHRLRGDARAAPRRRARRLRARLRHPRHRRRARGRTSRHVAPGRPPHPRLPADARRRSPRRCCGLIDSEGSRVPRLEE